MKPPRQLAIDLGTSHTVAVVREPEATPVPLMFNSSPLLPSAVYADRDGGLQVGLAAQRMISIDPGGLELNPKLRIDDGEVLLNGRTVPVVDMYVAILSQVRAAMSSGGADVAGEVVLTHPAAWVAPRKEIL